MIFEVTFLNPANCPKPQDTHLLSEQRKNTEIVETMSLSGDSYPQNSFSFFSFKVIFRIFIWSFALVWILKVLVYCSTYVSMVVSARMRFGNEWTVLSPAGDLCKGKPKVQLQFVLVNNIGWLTDIFFNPHRVAFVFSCIFLFVNRILWNPMKDLHETLTRGVFGLKVDTGIF